MLLAEKTSTPKESLRVSFPDVVTHKLFDSQTLAGRPTVVPRRQINLGYDDMNETNLDPSIRDEGWNSYSDLSWNESSNQRFSD